MLKTAFLTASAVALALSLGAAPAFAKQTHTRQLASPAQLQREHNRAVKAGDTANDPFDSSSSDALNQQQLAGAPTGQAPSMASTPMTDANTGVSTYTDTGTGMSNDTTSNTGSYTDTTADTGNTGNAGVDTSTTTSNDNTNNNASTDTDTTTPPPSDQPATTTQQQDNGSTSMPSSDMPSSSSMPSSQLPTSTDATTPQ